MRTKIGTVYVLHFDRPYDGGHGQVVNHYIGFTELGVAARNARHHSCHGAALLKAVANAGIDWQVADTYENETIAFERKLKGRGGAKRICSICRGSKYQPRR